MKKSIAVIGACLMALTLFSCASKETVGSGIKGKNSKVKTQKTEIVDYQGSSLGSEIPQWVKLVNEGQYSEPVLKTVMPGVAGKKIWVVMGRGDNLEFVKQWTDLVDVEVQVADTLQRVVGKAVSAQLSGANSQTGGDSDPTTVERTLNMYKEAVSTVEVNGLEKTASYWIQCYRPSTDEYFFEYYSVWTMNEDDFDKQLTAALKNVDDNTSESSELKAGLRQQLMGSFMVSNDATVVEEADRQVIAR